MNVSPGEQNPPDATASIASQALMFRVQTRASAPSVGPGHTSYASVCLFCKAEYFCLEGLTRFRKTEVICPCAKPADLLVLHPPSCASTGGPLQTNRTSARGPEQLAGVRGRRVARWCHRGASTRSSMKRGARRHAAPGTRSGDRLDDGPCNQKQGNRKYFAGACPYLANSQLHG